MGKYRKTIIQLLQWGGALIIALIACNIITFIYERPVGWIELSEGATSSIWHPNTLLIHGTEGRGVYMVDSNGYINDDKDLEDSYILVIGSSHTQGREVPKGKRYSDLLNNAESRSHNKLAVYNLSSDGYYLPEIIRGFNSSIQAFPNASKVIIETVNIQYKPEEIERALRQSSFSENQIGEKAFLTASISEKIKFGIKEIFPVISRCKRQAEMYQSCKKDIIEEDSDRGANYKIDLDAYEMGLNKAFHLISSEFSGEIIILYHPRVSLDESGMSITTSVADEIFENACERNGIVFINVGDRFLEEYEEDYVVAYGFNNTSMGVGHLNEEGHRMIAEAILEHIKEDG